MNNALQSFFSITTTQCLYFLVVIVLHCENWKIGSNGSHLILATSAPPNLVLDTNCWDTQIEEERKERQNNCKKCTMRHTLFTI